MALSDIPLAKPSQKTARWAAKPQAVSPGAAVGPADAQADPLGDHQRPILPLSDPSQPQHRPPEREPSAIRLF